MKANTLCYSKKLFTALDETIMRTAIDTDESTVKTEIDLYDLHLDCHHGLTANPLVYRKKGRYTPGYSENVPTRLHGPSLGAASDDDTIMIETEDLSEADSEDDSGDERWAFPSYYQRMVEAAAPANVLAARDGASLGTTNDDDMIKIETEDLSETDSEDGSGDERWAFPSYYQRMVQAAAPANPRKGLHDLVNIETKENDENDSEDDRWAFPLYYQRMVEAAEAINHTAVDGTISETSTKTRWMAIKKEPAGKTAMPREDNAQTEGRDDGVRSGKNHTLLKDTIRGICAFSSSHFMCKRVCSRPANECGDLARSNLRCVPYSRARSASKLRKLTPVK
jgi:hypothetical protein